MSKNEDFYRLWQHDNGTYYVIWSLRAKDKSCEFRRGTKRISTGTTDRKIAEQFRAQFISGLNNPIPITEPTMSYLLKRYYDERGPKTRSQETIGFHLKSLLPFFGPLLPSQLTNSLLDQYADTKKQLSSGTILRQLRTLIAAMHYAEGNKWIARLPRFSMPVSAPPPRDLWLTREQVALLLEKAKSPHIRLFILIAVSTAARSGAILDLMWNQIDFERGLINFGKGWGKKRRSIVPMNDDLFAELKIAKELAQTDYVIEFNNSRLASIKGAFRRLSQQCKIEASPHVLRHTAATWLVMDGVPLREVARLLGDTEATVEEVYGKHSPDYLRRAVSALSLKKPSVLQL